MRTSPKLAMYHALGFDRTENVLFTSRYRIRCSQCEALVINGVACHETRCPNTPRDDGDDDE